MRSITVKALLNVWVRYGRHRCSKSRVCWLRTGLLSLSMNVWSSSFGERSVNVSRKCCPVAECLSGILDRCRHNQFWRWRKVVPVWGGLNLSNSYSTGNPWSKRIDSRGHKLDGFAHGVVMLLLKGERTVITSVLFKKVLRKRVFGSYSLIWCCPEKWSGLNRISYPDWVKICVDPNSQIN